jgi:hypothetical protein
MAWAAATAVVAIVILLLLNRRAGYVVLSAVVIIGLGIWMAVAIRGPQPTAKDGLSAHASVDAEACSDPAKPIAIEFHNGNDRPIERSSFSLIARPTGHSTIAYRAFLRDDKIIAPGQSSVSCFGLLPHGFTPPRPQSIDLHDYDWSVEVSLVTFGNR